MSQIGAAVGAPVRSAPLRAGGMREVAALGFPVVLQNLANTFMQVVDTAIVGQLGAAAFAGVGFAGIWYWTAQCFFVGLASGVQSFVSQAHGAGEERACGPWIWRALLVAVPCAVVALALLAATYPLLLTLLQPAPELWEPSTQYIRTRALGVAGLLCGTTLHSFLRGTGDMRTPLVASVIANVANAALAYGLVYGVAGLPRMGVSGAGLATACCEYLYAGILLWATLRRPMRERYATAPSWPRLPDVRRFLRTSAPIGGTWLLDMIPFALFTTLITRMGASSAAASQAFLVLLHLSFMQVVGIQIAASTLVGRYVGARDLAAAELSHRSAVWLALALSAVASFVFVAAPGPLLRIFTEDAAVLSLGMPLLWLGAAFNLFDAVAIVASGSLRGAGDTRFPFWVQTALAWLVFLPISWVLGVWLEGGLLGAWIGASIYSLALSIVFVLRFRSGAWKSIRI
jgi:multidrug resistance protein, MATE family